jgi:hypothetical protein
MQTSVKTGQSKEREISAVVAVVKIFLSTADLGLLLVLDLAVLCQSNPLFAVMKITGPLSSF